MMIGRRIAAIVETIDNRLMGCAEVADKVASFSLDDISVQAAEIKQDRCESDQLWERAAQCTSEIYPVLLYLKLVCCDVKGFRDEEQREQK